MHSPQKLVAGGIAAIALALSAGAAFADPGQATASVNVRSGPGTSYAVLDTLYPGEDVDIGRCTGSWCYVTHSGPDGWVSANYLEGGGYSAPPVYVEPPVYQPAPIFITPPFHNRPLFHNRPPFHHRPSGPSPVHHPGPPHGTPPGHHRPPGAGGGGDFCTLHPTAPPCMPGASHHNFQPGQHPNVQPGQHRHRTPH